MANANASYEMLIGAVCVYSIGTITTAVLCGVEFCHGIHFRRERKRSKTTKKVTSTKSMWFVTILSIMGFCISCLCGLSTRIITLTGKLSGFCFYTATTGASLYVISKQLMYILFILRLYMVYKDSQHQYKLKTVIIMASISVTATLIGLILMILFGKAGFVDIVNTDYKNCVVILPLLLTAYAALVDIINQLVLIYLFIKPLIHLQNRANAQDGTRQNARASLRKLSYKYYILGLCASISTSLFLLTIPSLGTSMFVAVDCVVNSICLLLCFYHWDRQYVCMCSLCIGLVKNICYLKAEASQMALERVVSLETAKSDTVPV